MIPWLAIGVSGQLPGAIPKPPPICPIALVAAVATPVAPSPVPDRLDLAEEIRLFDKARAAAWAHHHEEALALYDRLLHYVPDDVDYLLGKAQVLVWSGRAEEALPLLRAARALAPDYEDLWNLEILALRSFQDPDHEVQANLLFAEAQRRFPAIGNPGTAGEGARNARRSAREQPLVMRWRPWLVYGAESLTGGRAPWQDQDLGLEVRTTKGWGLRAGVHRVSRFVAQDTECTLGADGDLGEELHASFLGTLGGDSTPWLRGGGDASHLLPTAAMDLAVDWTLPAERFPDLLPGIVLNLAYRRASYNQGGEVVDRAQLGLERYWDDFRAGIWGAGASVTDAGLLPYVGGKFAWLPEGTQASLGIALGAGLEGDNLGVLGFRTDSVVDLGVEARKTWGPVDVSWRLGWHRQGSIYDRYGGALGLTYGF